jgi:prepilin-type N-terminal cleavage/methylation domain-containing protein
MKSDADKTGLSLVEMLIVVAIVVILTTMVIGLAGRINDQSNERLTKSTIGILTTALGQFHGYGFRYKDLTYSGFVFPLDCNDFDVAVLQTVLSNALASPVSIIATGHDRSYSGIEASYFLLSRVASCRKTLDKIDELLITNLGSDQQPMNITITHPDGTTEVRPLFRIIDPWGTALRYDYYDEVILDPRSKRTFPVITSAGPDRRFGNADDISSRK